MNPLAYVSGREQAEADIIVTIGGEVLKNRHGSREDRVLVVTPTIEEREAYHRIANWVQQFRFRSIDEFYVGFFNGSGVIYLQHRFLRPDAVTGEMGWGYGRKWHVSPHATETEVVFTCLKAAITNAEHEVREEVTYKGEHVFQPHVDINALLDACQHSDARPAPPTEAERAEVLG